MTVFGLVIGRLRTGITVIRRPSLSTNGGIFQIPDPGSYLEQAKLFHHLGIPLDKQPNEILGFVKQFLFSASELSSSIYGGILQIRAGGPGQRVSQKDADLLRLHGIVSHELSRDFIPSSVSIQQVRNVMCITTNVASDSKRVLMESFKSSTKCQYENPETNTGIQCLSESWAVAKFMDRQRILSEIRTVSPDTVDRIRKTILNNKKIFDTSRISKSLTTDHRLKRGEDLSTVINDVLEHEIDKALVKRFNL